MHATNTESMLARGSWPPHVQAVGRLRTRGHRPIHGPCRSFRFVDGNLLGLVREVETLTRARCVEIESTRIRLAVLDFARCDVADRLADDDPFNRL
jgi:hypothetical protein